MAIPCDNDRRTEIGVDFFDFDNISTALWMIDFDSDYIDMSVRAV